MNFYIGIKFCGNCNPQIDAGYLYKLLKEKSKYTFVPFSSGGYHILLVVNSCSVACVDIEKTDCISDILYVTGNEVLSEIYKTEDELASAICNKLENLMC